MVALTALSIGSALAILFAPVPKEVKGALVIVLLLALMFWGLHVGIAMALSGALGVFAISGVRGAITSVTDLPFDAVASWSLSILPMFILMGMFIAESGLAARLYQASRAWFGWLPGNMAVSTTLAGAGLAATSGTTLGITYALGRIGIPEMLRRGYDPLLTTGSVMVVGTLGQLIPPSLLLVIYATVAETPMGAQLMSGIIPGILMAALYILLILVLIWIRPSMAPNSRETNVGWTERFKVAGQTWPLVFIVAIVIGGMLFGFVTPTEAAAAGAVAAALMLLILKGRKGFLRRAGGSVMHTLAASGAIFLLIVGTLILGRAVAVSGLARWIAEGLFDLGLAPWAFLALVGVVYLLLGTFLEPIPLMLMTVPVLLPAVEAYEISLIWFGVYVVLLGEIGVLTPPVGMLAFVVFRIAQSKSIRAIRRISLNQVYLAALLFMPAPIALAILLIVFPQIATWLPDYLIQRGNP